MKLPLATAILLVGCGGGLPSPYLQRQLDCVADAATREQADTCRCAVRASSDNPCDAGAGDAAPMDGGRP